MVITLVKGVSMEMKHLTEKERGILICLNESEDTWRPPIYKDDIKEFLATIDFLRQESAIWEKQSLVALVNERDLLLKEVEALREAELQAYGVYEFGDEPTALNRANELAAHRKGPADER